VGEDWGLSGELWFFVCIALLPLGCVSCFALKGFREGLEGKERLTILDACSWGRILVGGEHGEGVWVDSDRFQWDTEGSCRARMAVQDNGVGNHLNRALHSLHSNYCRFVIR